MDVMESTEEVANSRIEEAFIRETVAKAMVKIEAKINTTVEAFKASSTPAANLEK